MFWAVFLIAECGAQQELHASQNVYVWHEHEHEGMALVIHVKSFK